MVYCLLIDVFFNKTMRVIGIGFNVTANDLEAYICLSQRYFLNVDAITMTDMEKIKAKGRTI